MNIIGINAGPDLVFEQASESSLAYSHDSAAVLVRDGVVVAGMEEERLNRIKHSPKAPIEAIRFCLEQGGIGIEEVDYFAFYLSFHKVKFELELTRAGIQRYIRLAFGYELPAEKIRFVHHHIAHAFSTYAMSRFDKSLIFSVDGSGDGISGMVLTAENRTMKPLRDLTRNDSLGDFYERIIQFLGYRRFDEYKVMGLAPYGDPSVYRSVFKTFYSLLPNGNYRTHINIPLLFELCPPRKKAEPFTQQHKDIAAALQEALEDIILHIVTHFKKETNHDYLCLAGGVAHNCTMNGKLLYSGLFKDIFIQPAAHDAGAALGAALHTYHEENPGQPYIPLEHLYWGKDIGSSEEVRQAVQAWDAFVEWEYLGGNTVERTSQLLAEGNVIGWVQGRSEFGPRALGNRSIVADPRPEENKHIINAMVKMREGYRPFAPSVLEEAAEEYYEIPGETKQLPYMIFVVKVKEAKRKALGAVTHVDGTARVQTVSRSTNPKYWDLIHSFGEKTGVPILLNTSFNNNVEPIVDSVKDSIVCYLTTKLNYLVVGDFLVKKKENAQTDFLNLYPQLPQYAQLHLKRKTTASGELAAIAEIGMNYSERHPFGISLNMFTLLSKADGQRTFLEHMQEEGWIDEPRQQALAEELLELWSRRMVNLDPAAHEPLHQIYEAKMEVII